MYRIAMFILLSVTVAGQGFDSDEYRNVENSSFEPGEEIKYKVHYGFINAAEGRMVISNELYNINGRPCYKIDVFGRSVGMFDLFLRIRDNWGTYLDTSAIVTQKFYRIIEEGKYRKHEIVDFDQNVNVASVRTYDKKKHKWKPTEKFDIPSNVQDMVSGYYFLRTFDFRGLEEGEIINIDAFFDDEVYDFKIRYIGKEEVKTKLGRIRSVVFSPIMPENSLFDGEDAIRVWISDDANKVPLKIKAEMFVGSVEIDITKYKKR
ncbi:MAG: DUF3108 domain-containing protein [Bacteroidota bacterium]